MNRRYSNESFVSCRCPRVSHLVLSISFDYFSLTLSLRLSRFPVLSLYACILSSRAFREKKKRKKETRNKTIFSTRTVCPIRILYAPLVRTS